MNLRKKEKKEIIYDAALKVISRKGYHEATMQDIANEACLAVGTIYNYFASKEDMVFSLFKEKHAEYKELGVNATKGIEDPEEVFRVKHLKKMEFLMNEDSQVLILFSQMLNLMVLNEDSYVRYREIYQLIIDDIAAQLKEGKQHGFMKFDFDENIAASMMYGAFQYFIAKYVIKGKKITSEDIEASYDFLLYGLRGKNFNTDNK
jgi:TetR/AcrR family fatty acid metabolism transcriptional regulator